LDVASPGFQKELQLEWVRQQQFVWGFLKEQSTLCARWSIEIASLVVVEVVVSAESFLDDHPITLEVVAEDHADVDAHRHLRNWVSRRASSVAAPCILVLQA
jgi:hypothetical protein